MYGKNLGLGKVRLMNKDRNKVRPSKIINFSSYIKC